MSQPQDQQAEQLPIDPPHVMTRAHYERMAREAGQQK